MQSDSSMIVRCAHDKLVPIHELKAHPKNRNVHPQDQIVQLAEILKYQGWRYPVKVSNQSGFVTTGHGRMAAALHNGWTHVPVNFQDYDSDDMEYADVQADNAIASWAELDIKLIKLDIAERPNLDVGLLGIKGLNREEPSTGVDPDETPEPPKEAKTKRGELWILGQHRLLVDDCTVAENVSRLMNGEKADMVFTDPPYGMNLNTDYSGMPGTSSVYMPVTGDNADFDASAIFSLIPAPIYYLWGADYYPFTIAKYKEGSFFVWSKAQSEIENSVLGSRFELCWRFPKRKKDVWFVRSINQSSERLGAHPTQKPTELAVRAVDLETAKEAKIADPFLGSGSTLIACEKTNRRCFGMEIEPIYGQVIIERWCKFTGKEAYRLNDDGSQTSWTDIKNA